MAEVIIEPKIEDFIDAAPRGGDDGMLEGTEIKASNNFDDNWSDTSSEVSSIHAFHSPTQFSG
jgi:hypothetical protein